MSCKHGSLVCHRPLLQEAKYRFLCINCQKEIILMKWNKKKGREQNREYYEEIESLSWNFRHLFFVLLFGLISTTTLTEWFDINYKTSIERTLCKIKLRMKRIKKKSCKEKEQSIIQKWNYPKTMLFCQPT